MDGAECIVVDPDSESLSFSISEGSESLSDYEIASLSDFDINEEAGDAGSEDPSFDLDSSFDSCESDSDADISDWSIDENAEEPRISSGDANIAGPKSHEDENVFTTPLYKGAKLTIFDGFLLLLQFALR